MLHKLTYANVMSTLAVFLVLAGGGAYAAKKLSKNAVKTKNIKNLAVTEPKIANQGVTNPKIGDKQVKTGKLGEGSVTNAKLDNGAVNAGKTDFLVKSGRVTSDPGVSSTLTPVLISTAGVTLKGSCQENGANLHTGTVRIEGPANSFYSGVRSGDGLSPPSDATSSVPNDLVTAPAFGAAETRRSFIVRVVTPTTTVSLDVALGINSQGSDCVFAATAIAG